MIAAVTVGVTRTAGCDVAVTPCAPRAERSRPAAGARVDPAAATPAAAAPLGPRRALERAKVCAATCVLRCPCSSAARCCLARRPERALAAIFSSFARACTRAAACDARAACALAGVALPAFAGAPLTAAPGMRAPAPALVRAPVAAIAPEAAPVCGPDPATAPRGTAAQTAEESKIAVKGSGSFMVTPSRHAAVTRSPDSPRDPQAVSPCAGTPTAMPGRPPAA